MESKIIVEKGFDVLLERSYGKKTTQGLVLPFVEALYLVHKKKLVVKEGRKKMSFSTLFDLVKKKDKRIQEKYAVFEDLRDKGFVAKTGFKFGCDFRVYRRGVRVKKGKKEAGEHTKWIVYAVPEDYTCSFAELSRAVRLAHSIRAHMLWALVDNDNDVTYLEVQRLKP